MRLRGWTEADTEKLGWKLLVYAYPKNPPQINVAWIPAAEARRVFRGEEATANFRAILGLRLAALTDTTHHSQPPSVERITLEVEGNQLF